MTKEEKLKKDRDVLQQKYDQLETRLHREKKKCEELEAKGRGYRKARTRRLIIAGGELERLAKCELSVEDVRVIYNAAYIYWALIDAGYKIPSEVLPEPSTEEEQKGG